jgi:hypothetical protein
MEANRRASGNQILFMEGTNRKECWKGKMLENSGTRTANDVIRSELPNREHRLTARCKWENPDFFKSYSGFLQNVRS